MKKLLLALLGLGLLAGSILYVRSQPPASPYAPIVSTCIDDLASCDYQVRDQATQTLRDIGPEVVPYLIKALQRQDSPVKRMIARVRNRIPFLHVKQTDASVVREKAAEQLGSIGLADERVIYALIAALHDENESVLLEVQRALRRIGSSATLPYLVDGLQHRDGRIRRGCAQVLGDFGLKARTAIPPLIARLHDKDTSVRSEAARTLGLIGPDSESVRSLILALDDSSPVVRSASAAALGRMGSSAHSASPNLVMCFGDRNTSVRIAAAKAIWLIEHRADLAVPILIAALRDRSCGTDAQFVLGEIGPDASQAIPALVRSMEQETVTRPLRTPPTSALALGRIGAAAVPSLIPLLHHERSEIRTSAAIALGFIGAPATNAAPDLLPLLSDRTLEVRQATALSLGSIEPDNRELIPALKRLARDDDIFLASSAASMLRHLDPAAAAELGVE